MEDTFSITTIANALNSSDRKNENSTFGKTSIIYLQFSKSHKPLQYEKNKNWIRPYNFANIGYE